ncbi:MAG TPA: 23S rRNA (pseudouridine(1915)-N(3))-methyltransferase RlmH [Steroidobacteraceae bacterium]|jgi:23S rRNA (pseudouridine1915-N3)-methyltransferase|nr:23S rRNA (pseudouridine(1915)-N(3))-methyltransferase RlmH [Steroidobacteraceae bacterium]
MKCRLIAAGTRLPDWINTGFSDYQRRLRSPLALELEEITVARRSAGDNPAAAVQREGADMMAAIRPGDYVVALEVKGKSLDTPGLAAWLADRMRDGRPLALLIGGPDGLAPPCRERADQAWSLSPLTLPHGLARVVVAEQIYRAMSLLGGHPYHRA